MGLCLKKEEEGRCTYGKALLDRTHPWHLQRPEITMGGPSCAQLTVRPEEIPNTASFKTKMACHGKCPQNKPAPREWLKRNVFANQKRINNNRGRVWKFAWIHWEMYVTNKTFHVMQLTFKTYYTKTNVARSSIVRNTLKIVVDCLKR